MYIDLIVLIILILSISIPLIQNIGIEILRAINMQVFRSVVYFIIAIGNVVLSINLCQIYGATGAAMGTAFSLLLGNVFIMNVYYYKKVKINIIRFWKSIGSIMPSFVVPFLFGIWIYKFYVINNIVKFMIFVSLYTIVFIISVWKLGLNDFEKNLVIEPVEKIFSVRRKK